MGEEKVLVKSTFDASACHKFALIWYFIGFVWGFILCSSVGGLDVGLGFVFLCALLVSAAFGGIIHLIVYFASKNNKITLTNYKIVGIDNRRLALNIPMDSVTSVSKVRFSGLCLTCAGNRFDIYFVGNRDVFYLKISELLNARVGHDVKEIPQVTSQNINYDELQKLKQLLDNEIITREEFDTKKKQFLGL